MAGSRCRKTAIEIPSFHPDHRFLNRDSVVANVAIAFQGPYDSFVQFHPAEYVKLPRWFNPVARLRPLLDPPQSQATGKRPRQLDLAQRADGEAR